MKRRLLVLAAMLLPAISALAYRPAIRDIDITVTLHRDGSATVAERWDVCAADGTEWYLVRSNLGDIRIGGLRVNDENGIPYTYIGEWDVDRSIEEKAGKCGIVSKRDGVEICWGIGSLGDHVFDISYTMTNAVKTLEDYDMLHIQLVSPGLSSRPQNVKVRIVQDSVSLNTDNTRAWGFGYEGSVEFEDGGVDFRSGEPFKANSSVIALLRFDKGIFESGSIQDRKFEAVLDRAMEGADFGDGDGGNLFLAILRVILVIACFIGLSVWISRSRKKSILGVSPSKVEWCRDIPFDGNLACADHVLSKLGEGLSGSNIASALILRMIYNGIILVSKDGSGNVELSFNDTGRDSLDSISSGLYDMMLKASGNDRILQDKEFSKWSSSHKKDVYRWVNSVSSEGKSIMRNNGYISGSKFLKRGQEEARKLMGLKKFLKDFTLMKEKDTIEATTWREYLVYGAMFGIADKVAQQLKDIDPKAFETVMEYDYGTTRSIIYATRSLSRSITNTSAEYATGGSSGGFGGRSSFGGGGGFSGGGVGGGSR